MKKLPEPNPSTLQRRRQIILAMRKIVTDPDAVLTQQEELRPYECDGLSAYCQLPLIVVLPATEQQVKAIMQYCEVNEVRIVPRGAGTGVSGGATPLADAITISMMKFNHILEIDIQNRCAVIQPGVSNQAISDAVNHLGLYYGPDPSSQMACSIGGNVAENAGGIHCLKYGLTVNNVIGARVVLLGGEVISIGGKAPDCPDYDLLGIINGSEGMLGIVTEVTVKLLPQPVAKKAVLLGFSSLESGSECVADIISSGIIPAALEMLDGMTVNAVEDAVAAGYPRHVEGLLICELDGEMDEVDYQLDKVIQIAENHQAIHIQLSQNEQERVQFWTGRKSVFAAMSTLAPDFITTDGTVPRGKASRLIREIKPIADEYGLKVATVFHAGDGNIHSSVLYDAAIDGEFEKAEALSEDILRLCVKLGGVLSGEHGVGLEKRDLMGEMFSKEDLSQQQRLKCAFDQQHLLNPGKVFPTLRRCGELNQFEAANQVKRFPDLDRY